MKSRIIMISIALIWFAKLFAQSPVAASIYTPNGSLVPDTYIIGGTAPQCSDDQLDAFSAYLNTNYDGAQLLGPPDPRYNCHAYAWYMYWEDNPQMVWLGYYTSTAEDIYWTDHSYTSVQESEATIVSYYGNHSAIRENSTWYRSKWGQSYLVRHHPNSVPSSYQAGEQKSYYKFDERLMGVYSQIDNFNWTHEWDLPETNFYNHGHLICRPKCSITLSSSYFIGRTVSYSGDSPSTWTNNNNGTINLSYPYSANTWKYTTVSVSNNQGLLYRFYIDVMPAGGLLLNNLSMNVNLSGHSLLVSVNGDKARSDEMNVRDDRTNVIWNLCIVNVLTGKQMYLGKIEDWTKSLDTTGWPVGVYAIMAQCGEENVTQKLVIK